jgi:hypothetical protein
MRSPGVLWIKAAVVYLVMESGWVSTWVRPVIMSWSCSCPFQSPRVGHHWRWSD